MLTVQEAEGQFMPIRDAAQLLCVHANTLRRWGDKGIIRAYRLGDNGHRRFLRQDVVNLRFYLLSHSGNPMAAHLYSTSGR